MVFYMIKDAVECIVSASGLWGYRCGRINGMSCCCAFEYGKNVAFAVSSVLESIVKSVQMFFLIVF